LVSVLVLIEFKAPQNIRLNTSLMLFTLFFLEYLSVGIQIHKEVKHKTTLYI